MVSVIMPALNEESNIAAAVGNVLESYAALGISGEVIVVDDGSTDRTGGIAAGIASQHPSVRVIRHASPQGIGASFWDGVGSAQGEMVVMLPGDGENDAAEILRYLPLMEHVDIVVPYVYNTGVRPLFRRFLSSLYTFIINLSFGMMLRYFNGTVLYRRAVFEGISLRNGGFFYQTELLVKTIRRGYLYAEVPCALRKRAAGRSKATTFSSLVRVAKAYLTTFADARFSGGEAGGIAPGSVTARRSS